MYVVCLYDDMIHPVTACYMDCANIAYVIPHLVGSHKLEGMTEKYIIQIVNDHQNCNE